MICQPGRPVGGQFLEDTAGRIYLSQGGCDPPRSTVATADRLAFERRSLSLDNYSSRVIQTIQASRRPSTDRIYDATWKAFFAWCSRLGLNPASVSVPQILEFLQGGVTRGYCPTLSIVRWLPYPWSFLAGICSPSLITRPSAGSLGAQRT